MCDGSGAAKADLEAGPTVQRRVRVERCGDVRKTRLGVRQPCLAMKRIG